jgi:hypothetical protein
VAPAGRVATGDMAQVCARPDGGTRFVCVADVLPNEVAERAAAMMDRGLGVMRRTLERALAKG